MKSNFRKALETDLPSIETLLMDAQLPVEGVREHLSTFLVAEHDGKIIGVIGLELYNHIALVRSAVVVKELRDNGLGSKLYGAITDVARNLNVKQFVLLTTTAEKFFTKKGFHKIDRLTLTGPVVNSIEFTSACPSSAICMTKEL